MPLFSSRHPIRSLCLSLGDQESDIRRLELSRLNFSSIKQLGFSNFSDEKMEAAMNLAVQSRHHDIGLAINSDYNLTMKNLRHELLHRVSHLDIHCC